MLNRLSMKVFSLKRFPQYSNIFLSSNRVSMNSVHVGMLTVCVPFEMVQSRMCMHRMKWVVDATKNDCRSIYMV